MSQCHLLINKNYNPVESTEKKLKDRKKKQEYKNTKLQNGMVNTNPIGHLKKKEN